MHGILVVPFTVPMKTLAFHLEGVRSKSKDLKDIETYALQNVSA